MPVPVTIADLSATAASNSPAGAESVSAAVGPDDYLRAHAAIIKTLANSVTTDIATAVSNHVAAADPHPLYALESTLGTASTKDTGTASGNVPLVGTESATDTVAGLVRKSTPAENAAGTGTGVVAAADLPAAVAALGVPAGALAYFAMNTAPTGWLKANGAAVSRTTYAALFAAIGTTFGAGDGSTTFLLPDLRGEFLRGFDDGRGVDAGRVFGSWQADDFKSHSHVDLTSGMGGIASSESGTTSAAYGEASTTGATGGTETRPRNIALLACIKY